MNSILKAPAILAVIVMIVCSAGANFLFGTTMSGGTIGIIFGMILLTADLFKSYLPIVIAGSMKDKCRTKGTFGIFALVLLVSASFLAGIGYSLTVRTSGEGSIGAARAEYTQLVQDKDRYTKKLSSLETQFSTIGQGEAAIAEMRQNFIWTRTKGCTDATIPESRGFCQKVEQLRADLAVAKKASALQGRLQRIEDRLGEVDLTKANSVADVQSETFAKLLGADTKNVQFGLSVLVAGIVEFVSAFGLWFLGVSIQTSNKSRKPVKAVSVVSKPEPVYNTEGCLVSKWASVTLTSRTGSSVSAADLIDSYREWCYQNSETPVTGQALGRRLTALGYGKKKVGGKMMYTDLAFCKPVLKLCNLS